ncbi:hypothetical protein A2W14_03495 [Candidatus Gottesmanbacteria bacterium RBG_16_37_8]|uniref:NrtR DNA-binding winged helix domain-containing protein n=1 Tax=Candidatus Gottesmanbacteria bacterium RBG_16_37_8 TaxID=1798371 RepID=A0A1F5YTA7_9BACT|nr:MAG: hypothetical protein A2W14_03495 [Candidatus Gottesmanbacteria bacterium RBG_16_37_8]
MAISVRVKTVLFSVFNNKLHIYLPGQRLPQGLVAHGISLNKLAMSVIESVAGQAINESYLEQLYTFSHPFEQMMEVDVVYYLLLPAEKISEFYQESWIAADSVSRNISEYGIISYAIQRLRWKVEYTNVVYSLLPREFTLSELQRIYESILGRKLDKRNFRRKILSLGLLRSSGRKRTGLKARPARMFRFRERKPSMVQVF